MKIMLIAFSAGAWLVGVSGLVQAETPSTTNDATQGTEWEEVLVTAQRRSENLQNVPIAVEAVSGNELTSSGITNVQDLRDLVPGIYVASSEGYETTHLRGVGSTAVGPGLENPVALYVDGVYYASTESSMINFVDVAQVEVLKGPQGTLFGRNATGGLIQITTNDPTQTSHLDAHVGYGNYQTEKGDLSVSGGISPDLAASFVMQGTHQGEGYGRNLFTGRDIYQDFGDATLRTKWLWTPSDVTKLTTILDYSQSRNDDLANALVYGKNPVPGTGPVIHSSNPWDTDTDTNNFLNNRSGGASIRLDQDITSIRLMNLVAYRRSFTASSFDIDATETPFETIAADDNFEDQFSEELQLSSLPGSPVTWTGGLYYYKYAGQYSPTIVAFGGVPVDPIAPFNRLFVYAEQRVSSIAPYGQATVTILPDTNLTGGVRYTSETRHINGTTSGQIAPPIPLIQLGPPDVDSATFTKFTYRAALDHRFSPELLAYASYNTGFKSGGFNPGSPGDPAFKPETLDAAEVGLKSDFLDRRARANFAVFDYDYKNIQVQKLELAATGIVNGAAARIYGVDFDSELQLPYGLRISGGLEWLHDEFNNFPDAPISSPLGGVALATGSATGNRLPFAPDFVGNVGLEHSVTLPYGSLHTSVAYSYNSGYYAEADNVLRQGAYNNVNATMRWQDPGDHYSVAIWGNNLTNAAVVNTLETAQIGDPYFILNPPRTYGVTVGFHY